MKKITRRLLMASSILLSVFANAQQVAINEDGSLPNANAILDVKSFTKGVLIPRVSTAQRNAIPNTRGLLVYDTTLNAFSYNDGTSWINLASSASAWSLTGNTGLTAAN